MTTQKRLVCHSTLIHYYVQNKRLRSVHSTAVESIRLHCFQYLKLEFHPNGWRQTGHSLLLMSKNSDEHGFLPYCPWFQKMCITYSLYADSLEPWIFKCSTFSQRLQKNFSKSELRFFFKKYSITPTHNKTTEGNTFGFLD